MIAYQTRLIEWLESTYFSGDHDAGSGVLTTRSLYPVELYMNLSRELATHDYTYGTREQLEWAITYLSDKPELLQDPDEFGDADWLAKTSSLDPADREVTTYIA